MDRNRRGRDASKSAYAELAEQYPELTEMWQRFASLPIRNAGTLGGNVANGSPIGDSMPGADRARRARRAVRRDRQRADGARSALSRYQKKAHGRAEFVVGLKVPTRTGVRAKSAVPHLQALEALRLRTSPPCARRSRSSPMASAIREPRVAFGGMAATPKRAAHAEAVLADAQWHEATAQAAMLALGADYAPLTDMRASRATIASTAAQEPDVSILAGDASARPAAETRARRPGNPTGRSAVRGDKNMNQQAEAFLARRPVARQRNRCVQAGPRIASARIGASARERRRHLHRRHPDSSRARCTPRSGCRDRRTRRSCRSISTRCARAPGVVAVLHRRGHPRRQRLRPDLHDDPILANGVVQYRRTADVRR